MKFNLNETKVVDINKFILFKKYQLRNHRDDMINKMLEL